MLDRYDEDNVSTNETFAHIKKVDKEHIMNMQRLTTVMETLGNFISAGFATLTQLLQQVSRPGHF